MNCDSLKEAVIEKFIYNPESGDFIHRGITPRLRKKKGSIAGNINGTGYVVLYVCGKLYKAHRLAYLLEYGHLPKVVDHINGNRSDNRILNLRGCTHAENLKNTGISPRNTSGLKGVSPHKGRWKAMITSNGKVRFLGVFDCKEDAARSWNTAARMYHGEFAFTNELRD